MNLLTPSFGLIIWQAIAFLGLVFILAKVAWKPILSALKEREQSIADALDAAEQAKEEMRKLTAQNEELLIKASKERDEILRTAREAAAKIIEEANEKAAEESGRIIANAQETIVNEKNAAILQVRSEVADLSLTIAEKILRAEVKDKGAHSLLIQQFMQDIKQN